MTEAYNGELVGGVVGGDEVHRLGVLAVKELPGSRKTKNAMGDM
jgi:hypothetical protein